MRFVPITNDVSIQYWLEFIGEAADKIRGIEAILRPYVADIYYEPARLVGNRFLQATARLYLDGKFFEKKFVESVFFDELNDAVFRRVELNALLWNLWVQENFCKLQLRRENGARIVCFRPTDEHPAFTGFGRVKPGTTRSCHQDFSETYVDRRPGTKFINYKEEKQVWDGFKPLYLKVQPVDQNKPVYYLEIDILWPNVGNDRISIFVRRDGDVPEELVAYQFSQRGGGTAASPEADLFETSAAIRKFVKK